MDWTATWPPRCSKCGRFVALENVGGVYRDAGGVDTVVDMTHCPRDGLTEVSWY